MKIHEVHFVLTNQVFLGMESVLECGWCIYFLHWKKNSIFPLLAVADGFFVSGGTPGSLWPLSAGIPSGAERNAFTCLRNASLRQDSLAWSRSRIYAPRPIWSWDVCLLSTAGENDENDSVDFSVLLWILYPELAKQDVSEGLLNSIALRPLVLLNLKLDFSFSTPVTGGCSRRHRV